MRSFVTFRFGSVVDVDGVVVVAFVVVVVVIVAAYLTRNFYKT